MVAWKRRHSHGHCGWTSLWILLLWLGQGTGIRASPLPDALVNQHVLVEIHTTLHERQTAPPDAAWMLTLDVVDDDNNDKESTQRLDKILSFSDDTSTVVTLRAVVPGQTLICALWQDQILLARQVVTPQLGRTSLVKVHAVARPPTVTQRAGGTTTTTTTTAWRILQGLVKIFLGIGLVTVGIFWILLRVLFDEHELEELDEDNAALLFQEEALVEGLDESTDEFEEEAEDTEEEEENHSDDDQSEVLSHREDWQLYDDDDRQHPASPQVDGGLQEVYFENLPAFRLQQVAQEDASSREDDDDDDNSSLGPTLPPVVERHVVRPQEGKTTFEEEMERFSQLQLGSPQSFHGSSPVFRRMRSSPPPAASENAIARGPPPPQQPLLVDRTRFSPIPFPTLGENDSAPTADKPSTSQKLEYLGSEEYDPLDEEEDDDEFQESYSSDNAEQNSHGDEQESSEEEISQESHFANNTEQHPSDNEQTESSTEESPRESSSINHDDRSFHKDEKESSEHDSRENSDRPSHDELGMRLELEVEQQKIPSSQGSPQPSQFEADACVEPEDEQQSIRTAKQSSQPSPTREDTLEEEQNNATCMESLQLLPAQKDTLVEYETSSQAAEQRVGDAGFPKESDEDEQQAIKCMEQSAHGVADGLESAHEDSSLIAGVVNLSQPSEAPPANESVQAKAKEEQQHETLAPKASLTQDEKEDLSEPTKAKTTTQSRLGTGLERDFVDQGLENDEKGATSKYNDLEKITGMAQKSDESPDDAEPVIEVSRTLATMRGASKPILTSLKKVKETNSLPSPPRPKKTPKSPKRNVKPCNMTVVKEVSFVAVGSQLDGNSASAEEGSDAEEAGQGSTPFSYVSTLSPDSRASPLNLSYFRTSPEGNGSTSSEQKIEKQISETARGGSQSVNVSAKKRSLVKDDVLDNQLDEVENPHATSNNEGLDSQLDVDENPHAKSNDEGFDNQPCQEENPDDKYIVETDPSSMLPEVTLSHSLRNAVDDIEAPMWEFSPEEALKPVPRKRRRRSKSKSSGKNLPFGSPRMSMTTRGSVKRKLIDLTEFKTPPLQEYGTTGGKRRARETSETDAHVTQPMAQDQHPTAKWGEGYDTVPRSSFDQMTSSTSG